MKIIDWYESIYDSIFISLFSVSPETKEGQLIMIFIVIGCILINVAISKIISMFYRST